VRFRFKAFPMFLQEFWRQHKVMHKSILFSEQDNYVDGTVREAELPQARLIRASRMNTNFAPLAGDKSLWPVFSQRVRLGNCFHPGVNHDLAPLLFATGLIGGIGNSHS